MRNLIDVIHHCHDWAKDTRDSIGADAICLFGSATIADGAQFDPLTSDLDIVVVIPPDVSTAVNRADWLQKLRDRKRALEVSLIPVLNRPDAATAIVSMLPITHRELARDIHKSAVRDFFRRNTFRDLLHLDATPRPLLKDKPAKITDRARQVLQFAQSTRNKYLAVSAANGHGPLATKDSQEPLPKELMRIAGLASSRFAQTADQAVDVQRGLDAITTYISQKGTQAQYRELSSWLSVRRGARGVRRSITPDIYVLLSEITVDMSGVPSRRARTRRATNSGKAQRSESGRQLPGKERATSKDDPLVRINGYKLFYFRLNNKLTFTKLARATGIDRRILRRLEIIDSKGAPSESWFATCPSSALNTLEDVLECRGKLKAGSRDDFLTQYMLFYKTYKGSSPSAGRTDMEQLELRFDTKVEVFDFDGTLTKSSDNRTTWEKIWVALGYSTEECFDLHRRFQRKEFSHQKWCDITDEKFRDRRLHRDTIDEIAGAISLLEGVAETIKLLRSNGVRLYILSGSIRTIILQVLGALRDEFDEIKANELVFDPKTGMLTEILGTPYDFEGKAAFLLRIIEELQISAEDILFVGNSCNDVFVSQSGVRTLCVNARFTDPDNEEHWTYAIRELVNFRDIMKYVQI